MDTKILGNEGEKKATKFLKNQGYKILERNYENKIGEIDIIAYDKTEDYLVFVEVKTKTSDFFGLPREMVGSHKQHKIEQVATAYLMDNKKINAKVRFDVVEVLDNNITHIKNAW